MGLRVILTATATTIVIYNVLASIFGSTGFVANTTLEKHLTVVDQNIKEIKNIHFALQTQVEALIENPWVLERAGHSNGLLAKNEIRVRLEGDSELSNASNIGNLVHRPQRQGVDEYILAMLALGFGILLATVQLVLVKQKEPTSVQQRPSHYLRRPVRSQIVYTSQGIRVQTASLE
jgi:cell division protein FtsB